MISTAKSTDTGEGRNERSKPMAISDQAHGLPLFDDGIPQSAAELSYFLLFSMFPLLMFVNSMLAQLDLSIEGMQPVLEMLPKVCSSS